MINNSKYVQTVGKNADPNDNSGLPAWAVEKVRQCYEICSEKNVIPPTVSNLDNLPETINNIRATGSVLPVFKTGENKALEVVTEWSAEPATSIGSYGCYYLFSHLPVQKIDLSTVKQIDGEYACRDMCSVCEYLTDINVSNVETISGLYACESMFRATESTTTSLHLLKTITGNYACSRMYSYCSSLTEMCLENLESVNGVQVISEMFRQTKIVTATFSKLKSIYGNSALNGLFIACGRLTDVYFPVLDTIESNSSIADMLVACTGVRVHFLASMQNVIGSWAAITDGFGGINTTVLFDLGVACTITVPAYTKMHINQFELDNLSSETATTFNLTLAPGQQQIIAWMSANADSEYAGYLVKTTENISEEHNQIVFDFGDYEYGHAQVTANVPMSWYSVDVRNDFVTTSVPLRNDGYNVANYGTTAQVRGEATDTEYELIEPMNVTFTGEDVFELEFFAPQEIITIDASNIEELITLDGYWGIQTVDGIDYITIHPTIANAYQDSKGIILEFSEETRRKIRVTVNAYVSSEANYDFGFVSYGTQQIYPTAAELKNGTISNGYYIYRDSGTNHSLSTHTMEILDSWILYASGNVVTIGWGQDSSTVTGTNTLYVESITVKLF